MAGLKVYFMNRFQSYCPPGTEPWTPFKHAGQHWTLHRTPAQACQISFCFCLSILRSLLKVREKNVDTLPILDTSIHMQESLWYFQHKETTQPSFCQSNLLIYRFLSEQPFHFHGQQDETAHCQSKCRL